MESRVRLIQGTIDDLPLSDSKFDAASCILVLHFIDDEQEKLRLFGTKITKFYPTGLFGGWICHAE
ncbi:class I SAM-dependent methyltransferase [Paenibacillus sp. N3.4]|uniref:class I SAM-dependent methyltransferase n=1 Tax=Paenibacillus sp. N3.4 TaxID=2603222 RepID=UPI0037CB5110